MVIEDCVYRNAKKSGTDEASGMGNVDTKGMCFGYQPDELDSRSGQEWSSTLNDAISAIIRSGFIEAEVSE